MRSCDARQSKVRQQVREFKEAIMENFIDKKSKRNNSLFMIILCAVFMVGAFLLLSSGNLGSWGFLVLLLCPVLHLIMHKNGHGSHGDGKKSQ